MGTPLDSSPNVEEHFKLNPCRKRKPIELFCHASRDIRELKNAGNQTNNLILKYRFQSINQSIVY